MPATYVNIATTTLGSNQSTVTFSSISNSYTDLLIKVSARSSFTGADFDNCFVRFNGDTGTNYSDRAVYAQQNAVTNSSSNNANRQFNAGGFVIPTAGTTASTFSNMEIYIPNYTASSSKPLSHSTSKIDLGTNNYTVIDAGLWRNTAAISSITFTLGFENFVTGSTFYLYGIKNS